MTTRIIAAPGALPLALLFLSMASPGVAVGAVDSGAPPSGAAPGSTAPDSSAAGSVETSRSGFDAVAAGRFAQLALDCVHLEYPNHISHTMQSDEDARPPRDLTPVFFGCYDWHSAVHGHWLLARLARTFPDAPFTPLAIAALDRSFVPERIAAEVRYLEGEGRASFERPYGLAWLLQLAAELRDWDDDRARRWSRTLRPLEQAARDRLADWLPKLTYPIRIGEHAQTAFAFGLILDWARTARDDGMEALLSRRIRAFYLGDRACPLDYEPSGHDFLSPCIAEADLMRRVLEPERYADWLADFLPAIPRGADHPDWLEPAIVTDRSDPKLAHLDGLNLSRAWMLFGIASGLPPDDPRRPAIEAAARLHAERGLSAVTGEHYEGGHWLGSVATYLVTERGLLPEPPE